MKTKHIITKYNNGIISRYKNKRVELIAIDDLKNKFELRLSNIVKESGLSPAVNHKQFRGGLHVDTIYISRQSLIALVINAMSILGVTNIYQLYDLEILEIERLRILEEQNQQIISETISEIETDIKRNKK